jgi:hypothetical protein
MSTVATDADEEGTDEGVAGTSAVAFDEQVNTDVGFRDRGRVTSRNSYVTDNIYARGYDVRRGRRRRRKKRRRMCNMMRSSSHV